VQCELCPHGCVLSPGDRGFCRSRVNIDGRLYSLAYGNPCAVHVDPIEKKPLFHFLPGSKAFSIAAAGCNFRCLNCQNWTISQSRPEDTNNADMMPESVVRNAIASGSGSIAYTYSEPVTFYEYVNDTAKIARDNGIKNVIVSNGYINEKPLREWCRYIDAGNIDLKGINDETHMRLTSGDWHSVVDTLRILKEEKVWFEVTNLIVPSWTDDLGEIRELCRTLYKTVGGDYPLHFSRFHPDYKLASLSSTPVRVLRDARDIAKEEGLNYVYIGNVPGEEGENTYCPVDGELCIERKGYEVTKYNLDSDGRCRKCGTKIPGIWKA